jgi:hypothetical protein
MSCIPREGLAVEFTEDGWDLNVEGDDPGVSRTRGIACTVVRPYSQEAREDGSAHPPSTIGERKRPPVRSKSATAG